jgi:GNAT superfamily N-acetyltransferase
MILYREMTHADIPQGLALCRSAGWNQVAEDWELLLELSNHGCRVAVDDEGAVKGSVSTVRYADRFSWIGMVLVDPSERRRGIGAQLLREALYVLSTDDTVKLDATPAGRAVYRQLDFVDEYPISRLQRASPAFSSALTSAVSVAASDLDAISAFDEKVFGACRSAVLKHMLRRAPHLAFVVKDRGDIEGYCFGRPGYQFAHIGPVIARHEDTAKELISAALQNCVDTSVVIDALHHTPSWLQWLSSIGFEEQRPLVRMFRGSNSHPGTPEQQFAILGPELG